MFSPVGPSLSRLSDRETQKDTAPGALHNYWAHLAIIFLMQKVGSYRGGGSKDMSSEDGGRGGGGPAAVL